MLSGQNSWIICKFILFLRRIVFHCGLAVAQILLNKALDNRWELNFILGLEKLESHIQGATNLILLLLPRQRGSPYFRLQYFSGR